MNPADDPLVAPGTEERFSPGPVVIGLGALALGLLGGYLLFGRPSATPAVALKPYTADVVPDRLGALAINRVRNLADWDPLDPFEGGFPLPPETWSAPIVGLSMPIPAVPPAPLVIDPGTGSSGGTGGGFVPSGPPLRGDVQSLPPMPPPDFGGMDVTPSLPSSGTTGGSSGTVPPVQPPFDGEVSLVMATLSGVDPKRAQSAVAGIAGKYKGNARTFSHMNEDGTVEAEGVLLLVPEASLARALADVRGVGGFALEEETKGSPASRTSKLRSPFASRLSALRRKREELLVNFLPEAEPVKDIDSAIDREARAVSSVRLTGAADRLAAIRILAKE